jgi:hypothetical protein
MKKALLLLLTACLAMPFIPGCAAGDAKPAEAGQISLSYKPTAGLIKDGTLKIGTDANGNEIAVLDAFEKTISFAPRSLPGKHGINGVIATIQNISLPAGFYHYSVDCKALTRNIENILLETRVIDRSTGKAIALNSFKSNDFLSEETETRSLSFYTEKAGTYDFQVFTYNSGSFSVSSFDIESVNVGECVEQDISAYLKDAAEDNLVYDENLLYYFDVLPYVRSIVDTRFAYDIISIITTLQGLANRDGVHLYINFSDYGFPNSLASVDNFWLDDLMSAGNFLHGKDVKVIQKPATLLRLLSGFYDGLAVWDEFVPATSNVAATVCGVENLLPVRYDARRGSLYNILTVEYGIKVKLNLEGKFTGSGKVWETAIKSTGSKKNDAYIWAIEKYLKTDKCSLTDVAYYTDAFSWDNTATAITYTFYENDRATRNAYGYTWLANRDYSIAKKMFFYDLFPYSESTDKVPNDDITQKAGTDYTTLELILSTVYDHNGNNQIYVHGYNNWVVKYANSVNNVADEYLPGSGGVEDEGTLSNLLSSYFCLSIANACSYTSIANASVFCQTPAIDYKAYTNSAPAGYDTAPIGNKYYLSFFMGDYDGITWPYAFWPKFLNDAKFHALNFMWSVSPACERIAPNIYQYLYKRLGSNVYPVASNNGAGFGKIEIFKNVKANNDSTTALAKFKTLTVSELDRMGIDVMGFMIQDFDNGALADFFNAKDGNGDQFFKAAFGAEGNVKRMVSGIPYTGAGGYYALSANDMADRIIRDAGFGVKVPLGGQFYAVRTIIIDPSQIWNAIENLQNRGYAVEVLDPYTFSSMVERTITG